MVLMISVKNTCRTRWFLEKESEELFSLPNEIGSRFCGLRDITTRPDYSLSIVDKVIERYYPTLKMGQTLASLEVKPGYGTYVLDFHISQSTSYFPHERIPLRNWRMVEENNYTMVHVVNYQNLESSSHKVTEGVDPSKSEEVGHSHDHVGDSPAKKREGKLYGTRLYGHTRVLSLLV